MRKQTYISQMNIGNTSSSYTKKASTITVIKTSAPCTTLAPLHLCTFAPTFHNIMLYKHCPLYNSYCVWRVFHLPPARLHQECSIQVFQTKTKKKTTLHWSSSILSITEETVESDSASSMLNDEISPQMELSSSLWTEGAAEDISVTVADSERDGEDSRSSCCKHQYMMLANRVRIIFWFTCCMNQREETLTFDKQQHQMIA